MPERFQLSRQRGARKPEHGIVCARPGRWGNAWTIKGLRESGFTGTDEDLRAIAVGMHSNGLVKGLPAVGYTCEEVRKELAGSDLGCWCPLDGPCHVDTLLEIANG